MRILSGWGCKRVGLQGFRLAQLPTLSGSLTGSGRALPGISRVAGLVAAVLSGFKVEGFGHREFRIPGILVSGLPLREPKGNQRPSSKKYDLRTRS